MKLKLPTLLIFTFLFIATACNKTPCPEPEVQEPEFVNHKQLIREVDALFQLTKTLMSEKDVERKIAALKATSQDKNI